MLESRYQTHVIKKLERVFIGCLVLKNDTDYLQGIPDLIVLYRDTWAMLEVKSSFDAVVQPNQRWYIEELNKMSFAAFIYPENEEEVFDALRKAFRARRQARVS